MTGSPGTQTLLRTNTNHYFHFTDKVTATQSMASDDLSGHPSGGDSNPDLLSLSTICYSALPRGTISSVIFPLTTRPLPLSFSPRHPLPCPPPRPPCFP